MLDTLRQKDESLLRMKENSVAPQAAQHTAKAGGSDEGESSVEWWKDKCVALREAMASQKSLILRLNSKVKQESVRSQYELASKRLTMEVNDMRRQSTMDEKVCLVSSCPRVLVSSCPRVSYLASAQLPCLPPLAHAPCLSTPQRSQLPSRLATGN